MAYWTLKFEISRIRIDPWIVEDQSLGTNKTKKLIHKYHDRSFELQGSILWKRRIFEEYSNPRIDPFIERIDPFIFVIVYSRFLRFGISIFTPRIHPQDLDFTLSLQNAIFFERKIKPKTITRLRRGFSLRISHWELIVGLF